MLKYQSNLLIFLNALRFWCELQGIGSAVLIGAGNETSGQINFHSLLRGKTVKGSIFGGIRPKSDLPIIFDKCLNKVCSYFCHHVLLTCVLNLDTSLGQIP